MWKDEAENNLKIYKRNGILPSVPDIYRTIYSKDYGLATYCG